MSNRHRTGLTRRGFLGTASVLLVSFTLPLRGAGDDDPRTADIVTGVGSTRTVAGCSIQSGPVGAIGALGAAKT